MKYKLWYGLFGCSSEGIIVTPNGKQLIKLPKKIAFKIHSFLNNFSYAGVEGTKLLFRKYDQ